MSSAPLVVEDDASIHELLEDTLTDAGFVVAKAVTADDAIALLERDSTQVLALLTDINLVPGEKTGWDVAVRARELRPETPVVYMTGASAGDWAAHGVPNSVLVSKPFAPMQVVTAISQLLNTGGPSNP